MKFQKNQLDPRGSRADLQGHQAPRRALPDPVAHLLNRAASAIRPTGPAPIIQNHEEG